jgi:formamidopyrimidine-DNA glycosylase
MPELPEVETIRRQLEPDVVGRRVEEIEVLDERWTRPEVPREVERAVAGRTIESLGRRGKYLLFELDGGLTLTMHLRMTGNLRLEPRGTDLPYLRAVLHLDDEEDLLFTDARRFGQGQVVPTAELDSWFAGRLGVEPLSEEFTADLLAELAADRRAPVKSFLLTQERIAGIGNIYADEALHRAALHPLSSAGSMKREHIEELREAIVATLEAGLDYGGASIDDYLDARGERGEMQNEFLVYGREGEPCPRCGEPIRRIVLAGRSAYFCANCQRRLRRRPRRKAIAR